MGGQPLFVCILFSWTNSVLPMDEENSLAASSSIHTLYCPGDSHKVQVESSLFFLIDLSRFQIRSKFWLFETLSRIFRAPSIHVEFRDFFLADQFMSTVIVLTD